MNAAAVTRHRLGFAVKVLSDGGLPSHDTRRWTSGPHLHHSLERLRDKSSRRSGCSRASAASGRRRIRASTRS